MVSATDLLEAPQRTYEVRTYGCQMNVHDSERLAGSLEAAGYVAVAPGEQADVVVLNTCAVRENADNRLYGNLGQLAKVKRDHDGFQIAVGGCLAQKDRSTILERAPWVDVVFGTHNVGALPKLLDRARHNHEAQIEILESLEVFPSTLPTKRESTYSGWVSIAVGCNNTCTFCIVPSLRGKEQDRRPGDVLAEIGALVDDGAIEVTLLGQNVNTYGVQFGDRQAFGKLLRATGVHRRTRARAVHQPAPRRVHRRRDRGDGGDRRRDAPAAHAAAVRQRPGAEGDAPLVPVGAVPAHPRRGAGPDPGRGDHHRHHRRLPGRDGRGLRGHAARRRAVALRVRVHLPVLDPARHARRDDAGPGAEAGRAGAVRAV